MVGWCGDPWLLQAQSRSMRLTGMGHTTWSWWGFSLASALARPRVSLVGWLRDTVPPIGGDVLDGLDKQAVKQSHCRNRVLFSLNLPGKCQVLLRS